MQPEEPHAEFAVKAQLRPAAEWLGIPLVFFLAVGYPFFGALQLFLNPAVGPITFMEDAIWMIGWSAAISLVVIGAMWMSRARWSFFGFRQFNWIEDLGGGIGLFVTWLFIGTPLWLILWAVMPESTLQDRAVFDLLFPLPRGGFETLVLVAMYMAIAFSEEVAVRGFLLPLLERRIGAVLSVLLTALFFGSFHVYQGLDAAIMTFVMGLIYGVYFVWQRRIWPLVIAHMFQGLTSYFMAMTSGW